MKFIGLFIITISVNIASLNASNFSSVQCQNGELRSCLDYIESFQTDQSGLSLEDALTQAARLGHVPAMFTLGVRALGTISKPVDINSAIYWFQQAGVNDDSLALLNLGLIFDHGIGIQKDLVKARSWYMKAANLGEPEALFNLGVFLDEGLGGKQDKVAAVKSYELATKLGHARAAYNLALIFGRGDGVKRNWNKAIKALRRSRDLGYKQAESLLKKWEKIE